MNAMSEVFVDLEELLIAAGNEIAQLTGNEAATVTSGASGGLVVQAAAAMAKDDPERIAQLPITNGMPNELIIQRGHRFVYDHLYLAPGSHFVEVGRFDGHLVKKFGIDLWGPPPQADHLAQVVAIFFHQAFHPQLVLPGPKPQVETLARDTGGNRLHLDIGPVEPGKIGRDPVRFGRQRQGGNEEARRHQPGQDQQESDERAVGRSHHQESRPSLDASTSTECPRTRRPPRPVS